jgi:hypothetical protein
MFRRSKTLIIPILVLFFLLPSRTLSAQDNESKKQQRLFKRLAFYDLRGTSALDLAFGLSSPNGDLPNPEFELYFKGGYKYYLTEHINLGIGYNKYNIAFEDIYNQGFMSFDVNLEYLMIPYRGFSPFFYAGYGYNAANYFENTASKVQGAFGIEILLLEKLALRFFAEYNYLFSDELEGVIAGSGDDTFFRGGVGLQIYFGGSKRKARQSKRVKTVINSNLILPDS